MYNRAVSIDEFIRIWRESSTLAEVAEKTGCTPRSCTVRARRLRQSYYELQPFKRGRKRRRGGGIEDRRGAR